MKKLRLIPPLVTFGAGAIASILLYLFQIDLLSMLVILLIVLFVFYVIGVIAMKILMDCSLKEEEVPLAESAEEEQESPDDVEG